MIPSDRQIHAKLYIARTDGVTWVDVSDYLARATINLGDVSGIGTGSGVDGRVRQMEFTLRNDEANSFAPRDRNSSWNQFNTQYAPLLWPYREVELQVAVTAPGVAPASGDWKTLFTGYLGDNISCDGPTVTCACRDKAKRLQDAYIETVRQYGSEAGTPAETVIQQILDDNLGAGVVTLSCPVSPGFMVKPYQVEYQSVWDAIQQVAAQFGWYLGYVGNTLTLMEPPRTKSTADFVLTAADDIYTQQLDINDADIRNVVIVTYRNKSTGQRASVTVSDAASIAEYGRRAMQIEEDDASLIDTAEEAQAFANAALADLKDLTGTTRLDMPLLPSIDVFTTISVNDPRISSTVDFYGVESVQHTLDWESGKFRTEVVASGRVIGAHTRWLEMQTRPGSAGQPASPPTTNKQPATPPTLTATANSGTVTVSWQPLGDPLVTRYEVWRKAGNYPADPTGAVKVAETDATSWVDTTATVGEQYTWYVRAKNVGSVTGAFTTGVVASVPAIGSSEISGDVFNLKADSDDGTGVAKPPTTGSLADLWDADLNTGASWTAGPVRLTFTFPTTYASDLVRVYAADAYPFTAEALDEDTGTWTTVIASGQTAANAWTLTQFDGGKLVHSRHFRITFNTTGAIDLRHCRFKASLVADEINAGVLQLTDALSIRNTSGSIELTANELKMSDPTEGTWRASPQGMFYYKPGSNVPWLVARGIVIGQASDGQQVKLPFTRTPKVVLVPYNAYTYKSSLSGYDQQLIVYPEFPDPTNDPQSFVVHAALWQRAGTTETLDVPGGTNVVWARDPSYYTGSDPWSCWTYSNTDANGDGILDFYHTTVGARLVNPNDYWESGYTTSDTITKIRTYIKCVFHIDVLRPIQPANPDPSITQYTMKYRIEAINYATGTATTIGEYTQSLNVYASSYDGEHNYKSQHNTIYHDKDGLGVGKYKIRVTLLSKTPSIYNGSAPETFSGNNWIDIDKWVGCAFNKIESYDVTYLAIEGGEQ